MHCPLCACPDPTPLPAGRRELHTCPHCRLVFAPPACHPTPAAARARYAQHHNSAANDGYVRFLEKIVIPALPFMPPSALALDYGCGPTPVLAGLLAARGHACDSYDPHFTPPPPRPSYPVIFATEVIEHFCAPAADFDRLLSLLAPDGLLCLMSEWQHDRTDFARWHYTSDDTHVALYHPATMDWLADRHRLAILHRDTERVIILRRPATLPPVTAPRSSTGE